MPRKKKPQVEVLRHSEEALVPKRPTEDPQAILDRMIRERVDEIMAEQQGGQLEPDFLPREVTYEIQRRQTMFERRRWSIYFAKHGCRRCDTKDVSHASNGHCHKCHLLIFQRLAVIRREYDKANTEKDIERQINRLTSRSRTAQKLLGTPEK